MTTAWSPAAEHEREQQAATKPAMAPTTLPLITRSTVHPGGLPARSSFWRIRSALSAPDSRRPRPENLFWSGISTRSPKDLSRSLVSSDGAVVIASMSSIDRATPVLGAALRIARPSRPKAVNTSSMPMMKSMVMVQTSTLMMRDIQNAPTARMTRSRRASANPGPAEECRDVLVAGEQQ
jgi:hypothetical protein